MTTAQIALRNVFRHRTRTLITIAAIAFGCTAVIFVGGFFEDILYKMQESYIKAHTGHLQVYRRGYSRWGSVKPFQYLIEDPQPVMAAIQNVPGVDYVTQRLQTAGLLSTGENTVSCFAQGVEPAHERFTRASERPQRKADRALLAGSVIEAGGPLDAQQPYGVVLGRGLAAGIGAKPGDQLILVSNTVAGSMNAFDVSVQGTFFTTSKAFDDYALRLPLPTLQDLLQTQGVQTLVVMLRNTRDTAAVRERLVRDFAARQLDLEVKTWEELSEFYVNSREFLRRLSFVLRLVVAIIVILSIYNTMNMAVLERTSEIGTLMALGTSRRRILSLFLHEGAILGLLGGLVGIALGGAVTSLVSTIGIPMPPPPGATMLWTSEPIVVPGVVVFALGLSVVTGLLSAFHPAYCASRLEIADALRHT